MARQVCCLLKAKPSQAQLEAGNYPKEKRQFRGLTVSIENPAGSVRSGVDRDGHKWRIKMHHDYGYINRSMGVDGDQVDCYIGPDESADTVYVVHQRKAGDWKAYDEDKCMLGFASQEAAIAAYLKHYDDRRFLGPVTAMPFDEFKKKVLATMEKPSMIKSCVLFFKSLVPTHVRRLKSGKVVQVRAFENNRAARSQLSADERAAQGSLFDELDQLAAQVKPKQDVGALLTPKPGVDVAKLKERRETLLDFLDTSPNSPNAEAWRAKLAEIDSLIGPIEKPVHAEAKASAVDMSGWTEPHKRAYALRQEFKLVDKLNAKAVGAFKNKVRAAAKVTPEDDASAVLIIDGMVNNLWGVDYDPKVASVTFAPAGGATDTRGRRKAALGILGDGWESAPDGKKDGYKKKVKYDGGHFSVLIRPAKTVDGNFYVGSYFHGGKHSGPGNAVDTPKTLEEARDVAESWLSSVAAQAAADLRHADLSAKFKEFGDGFELRHENGRQWAVLMPDATNEGKYRYQVFGESGLKAHYTYNNREEALRGAVQAGFVEPDAGAMDRLAPKWAEKFADPEVQAAATKHGDRTADSGAEAAPATERDGRADYRAAVGSKKQGPDDENPRRKYYVTMAREGRGVALLAGPFDSHDEAKGHVDRAKDEAYKVDPRSHFDAFGTSGIESDNHKPGALNAQLGIGQAYQPVTADDHPAPVPKMALSGLSDDDRAKWIDLHRQQHETMYRDLFKVRKDLEAARSKRNKAETAYNEWSATHKQHAESGLPGSKERAESAAAEANKHGEEYRKHRNKIEQLSARHAELHGRVVGLGKEKDKLVPGSGDLQLDLASYSRRTDAEEAEHAKRQNAKYKAGGAPRVVSVKPSMGRNQAVGNSLREISGQYHAGIPIGKILDSVRSQGFEPVQEDGTPWEGMLTGAEGRASIDLKGSKKALHVQWYKMPSGKYEVNAYLN